MKSSEYHNANLPTTNLPIPSTAGRGLGPYRIREAIGHGAMSVVYRAEDTRDGRTVAIKVPLRDALADHGAMERFDREIAATAAVRHPYVVEYLGTGAFDTDRDFLVLEEIDGTTLDQVMARGKLAPARALRYAVEIAEALAAVHEAGYVHRDVKPHNVMLAGGSIKLIDFGLAKAVGSAARGVFPSPTVTVSGALVGTPAYMSPEQIAGRQVDARTDVFSFGCLLYEMLSATSPFYHKGSLRILSAVLCEEPAPLTGVPAALVREVEPILHKALAKELDERYATMRDLVADLAPLAERGARAGTPALAREPDDRYSTMRELLADLVPLAEGSGRDGALALVAALAAFGMRALNRVV